MATVRLVWFQLVDSTNGLPYQGTGLSSVSLVSGSVVDQFRKAVKKEWDQPGYLKDIPSGVLQVFKNQEAFDKRNTSEERTDERLKVSEVLDDLGSSDESPLFVEVPSWAPVLQESSSRSQNRIAKLKECLFYTNFGPHQMGCVTAYTKKRFATFAHTFHNHLKVGDRITIHSISSGVGFNVEVCLVNPVSDYILLKSDTNICDVEVTCAYPSEGEEYVQLDLSAISQRNTPFSITRGVVSSVQFDHKGHFLGSADANPGESGGGCYSQHSNALIGINVGCDVVPISGNTTLYQLGTRHPARSHIVPSCFFTDEDTEETLSFM